VAARCLSIHARYACAHSGACCSDVWVIPAEPQVVDLIARRRVAPVRGTTGFAPAPSGGHAGASVVVAQQDGACVFFDRERGRLCAIHRDAGVEALPSSCRHFPRVYLRDDRGLHLSLSHFCPTAAAMLLDDVPLRIVEAAPPLDLGPDVEGLDAAGALPPLLRPDLLMDLDSYDAWERLCVATFARSDVTHETALDLVAGATEKIRGWKPGTGPLEAAVAAAFAAPSRDLPLFLSDTERLRFVEPSSHAAQPFAAADDALIRRYLASRVFGNWIAYRGRGLRSIVEWLRICLAVLRSQMARSGSFVEAVRETDRLMLHTVDSRKLAVLLIQVETA
jgi:Fe-S-cluster containining protein